MAPARISIQGLSAVLHRNALIYRIRRAFYRHILHDLKVILQPVQALTPLVIAVALGTVLSFIPAPVLDTFLVGVIIARCRQVNRSALLIARIVWNDLVVVPLYVPGFRLGMRLMEPFFADNTALPVRISAFSLGLLALISVATIVSVIIMFCFVTVLRQWQRATCRCCR